MRQLFTKIINIIVVVFVLENLVKIVFHDIILDKLIAGHDSYAFPLKSWQYKDLIRLFGMFA